MDGFHPNLVGIGHHELHMLHTCHVHVPLAHKSGRVLTELTYVRSRILTGFYPNVVGTYHSSPRVACVAYCSCSRTVRSRVKHAHMRAFAYIGQIIV
jgi:hypothetical protein